MKNSEEKELKDWLAGIKSCEINNREDIENIVSYIEDKVDIDLKLEDKDNTEIDYEGIIKNLENEKEEIECLLAQHEQEEITLKELIKQAREYMIDFSLL